MSLVVDTDVVSFFFKHDTRAALYTPHLSGHILTVSFQTLAELELWALASGWARAGGSSWRATCGVTSSITRRPICAAGGPR